MEIKKGEGTQTTSWQFNFPGLSFFNFNDSGSRVSLASASCLVEYANFLPHFSPAWLVFHPVAVFGVIFDKQTFALIMIFL